MKRKIIALGIIGCLLLVGLLGASTVGMKIKTNGGTPDLKPEEDSLSISYDKIHKCYKIRIAINNIGEGFTVQYYYPIATLSIDGVKITPDERKPAFFWTKGHKEGVYWYFETTNPDKEYAIQIKVDPEDKIDESNENNNVYTWHTKLEEKPRNRTLSLPRPTDGTADLVPPKNIGISFENPGILKVNIQITNRGKSFVLRSSDVIARLEYDGKIVGDCESYMFLWPFGLMVSRQLYITQPEKSGWYTFKVIVNPDGDIQNEYHDNNIQSYKKYILGTDKSRTLPRPEPTCGKPDIIVDNIEMPDGPFKVGERVDVTVTIKNDAATATDETFYVNVYTSGQIAPADIETVDGLRAYKTHKYSFSFYALATLGNGYLRVESDKGNYVNEQNELNNQKTVTFVVGKSRSVDSVFYRLIIGFPFLKQFFDLKQI